MEAFWHALSLGCFFISGVIGCVGLYLLGQMIIESIRDGLERRHQRRIARIEAELDEKQAELRRTILNLATQLAAERDEVSREMARQASLTSRKSPPTA